MLRHSGWTLVLAGCLVLPVPGVAQEPASTLGVYLDCQTFFCDFDHFRREITFVNWMRDQRDADVHVLVTAQQTGGGGWEFTFAFIGRQGFAGREDTLRYTSRNTDTEAEVREQLTQTITLGLVRYVAGTPVGRRLQITLPEAVAETMQQARPEDDPWNFWTFAMSVGGFLNGEEQQRFFNFNGAVSANRTTEDLKLRFRLGGRTRRDEFDIVEEDTTLTSTQRSWNGSGAAAFSVHPQWSLGVGASLSGSTFFNQDLAFRIGPAIEYDIYPYSESTRRQITMQYFAGITAFQYDELTVFGKTSEVLPIHTLRVGSEIQQPWGSIDLSVLGSQFLHDPTKHRVTLFGGLSVRLVRGLELGIQGSFARIKDQLHLSQAGLTPDQILLRQRQLGTDFRYFMFFDIEYTFGSRFANVVNPRMGDFFSF